MPWGIPHGRTDEVVADHGIGSTIVRKTGGNRQIPRRRAVRWPERCAQNHISHQGGVTF